MTPEKEKQIASRILERAELAQMTRQLRLNLGKASEKRKGDPDITEAIRKVSPRKTLGATPRGNSSSNKPKDSGTPPPPPPPSRDANILRAPATPRATKDDDVGADLLMYLATSPCASTTTTTNRKGPSTPNGFSPDETTVRLSHLKNSNPVSSPFKVSDSPMVYTLRGAHPSTPGRSELRFNMGDYVHNLFSPSPGFSNGIHTTPLSMEKPQTSNLLGNSSPGGHLKPSRFVRREDTSGNAVDSADTSAMEQRIDNDGGTHTDGSNGTTAGTGKNLAAEGTV
ncbi:hypothetical protein ZYGR_0I01180 [Zygosaccharomyces rouxii]|uniref:ZYRO0C02860p n=2 Tax=Zygosaccharomyces rouxii TaxID=4956 RepID=C5DST5_ZYGRC|nr:uncharacterized protein ZYRO0C02860g [Zygosaccharomyces rouxii]KAH9201964.1 hypothetical protein LQ764DRAFT_91553 [Zygosaccharomyces rouxii]GAV47822.1 hypothetical protein ZYGR_0I01180 [Zygosaccharomyces rouxii]CAR26846.1 ZYRO0C02860p [Zygosaccharomyces rouxii]